VFVTDIADSIGTLFRGSFTEVAYATWSGGFPDATALALERDYRLVVLLPGAVDACGHQRRMSSRACERATRDVDRYLGAVIARLDLTRDTLIVTADHGHVETGGHGGGERAVMEVPLVMAGAGIALGARLDGPRLIDLAPTVAALLGIPAPRHGLGRPLLDALALPAGARALLAREAYARIERNATVVAAEQAEGRAAQRGQLPHEVLSIAIAIAGLLAGLILLARVRALRLDRRSVLLGLMAPGVAVAAMFVDSDCLGSLSGFSSLHEWIERALFAVVVTAGFLMVGTMARPYATADQRLTSGNGVMAVALAAAGAWELAMSFLFERDPFVVLPGETVLFLLVATPVVLVALFSAVAVWRVIEGIAFVARLHGPIPVVAAAAVAGMSACAGAPARPAAPEVRVAPPAVVVLLVVDQLPAWSFADKVATSSGGFAELLRRGTGMVGRTPYAATATAPGHAALSTGAPPAVTGIIGNEWWDRGAGREVRSVEDPAGGSSTVHLRVEGVGDVVQRARAGSRAIAVSLKDRSALLALGKSGVAVWYDKQCPCLVSNARPRLPWLRELADPVRFAARVAAAPPPPPGQDAVLVTPLGDRIVLDAAIAALGDLDLDDGAPDYLAISLSAHDYIGHAHGPESEASWAAFRSLDAGIAELIAALDATAGRDGWAMILTSDHGAPPVGARLTYQEIAAVSERAATTAAGPGEWIAATRAPYVYLSAEANRLPAPRRAALLAAVTRALAATPGIERVWHTAELTGRCEQRRGDERALCLSIDPARAGEIMYSPAEGTSVVDADDGDAVTHGTVHDYDREVPVIVVAPGSAVASPGAPGRTVSTLRVAPTLAALLGVPPPPAARAASLLREPARGMVRTPTASSRIVARAAVVDSAEKRAAAPPAK
jgi:predicted AlkP superfamily pyrophosphatase or phosphodiesterase